MTVATVDILDLAEALAEAENKEQLTLIKSRNSEGDIKKAWNMLGDEIKRRLKSYCDEPKPPKAEKSVTSKKSTSPKLWELSAEVLSLENSIFEIQENDDLSDSEKENLLGELMEAWLGSGKEFDDKACNVAAYIKHLEALTEARKNEYRRLRDLAEQSEKQAEKLRSYLVLNMQKLDRKKINGLSASLSLRKKPAKVILNCEPEQLPEQFKKVEISPRLSEIKNYLKANPNCEFAQLSESLEYSVTIK